MQVAQTSHGPHYATSPQETGSSAVGNCTQAKLHYKHGPPQNLSTHGSLSQSPTFLTRRAKSRALLGLPGARLDRGGVGVKRVKRGQRMRCPYLSFVH